MKSPIGSIIKAVTYTSGDTVYALSTPYDLEYMENLCKDNVHIYMWENLSEPFSREPNATNLHIINGHKSTLPYHINCDLIICHDLLQQYKFAKPISQLAHIPLVIIEHKTKEDYGTRLDEIQNVNVNDILFDSTEIAQSWTNTDQHRIIIDHTKWLQNITKVLGKAHIK